MLKQGVQVFSFLCLSLLTLGTAWAQYEPYISIQEYYYEPDNERPTQGRGFGTDVTIGWPLQNAWILETRLFGTWIDDKGNYRDDAYRAGVGLDFRYMMGDPNNLSPYLIGGVGVVRNFLTPEKNETGATVNLGVGWTSAQFNDYGLRLRGDLRAVYDDFLDGTVDWRAGLGIQIPIRKPQERLVEVEKVVYREVEVPAPQPEIKDSDGDGVIDSLDQCPNTPAGALVDARGCQLYLEKDIKETLYVEFDLDRAEVKRVSYPKLNNLAENMRKYPSATLVLEGHTDSTGSHAYNQTLSARRADAVKRVLISQFGISPSRITTRAYGETQPIVSNATREGRAKNRRVETIMKATIKKPQFKQ